MLIFSPATSVLDLKKSNPKYLKIWFGFEKFFDQWFDLDLPWFSLKSQIKPNQILKKSGNVLLITWCFCYKSSRKSEISHKFRQHFGLILRNGLKYRCLSVSNRRQQWISSNRLTLRKIFSISIAKISRTILWRQLFCIFVWSRKFFNMIIGLS